MFREHRVQGLSAKLDHQEQLPNEKIALSWPTWRTLLASPLLYALIIPLVFLDLCLELYHRIVFPILGIPLVHRREYILIDRHRMSFLPIVLKIACAYCGYANGLLQYAVRIAGDTERYYCPSKHQALPGFHAPLHHETFSRFGDAKEFEKRFHGDYLPSKEMKKESER
jgi:hypothetical protein